MLEIDQLQVRADGSKSDLLIDGLTLSIKPGEAVGLMGPSGCGKTTLIRSIAGLIDPAGGAVTLDGKTPADHGWPGFRKRVCLLPQRPVVWDGSVASNLRRPFMFQTQTDGFDQNLAMKWLEQLGLAGKFDEEATTLSEGEKQRVCLTRTLLTRPDYVLMDEPTSALDRESIRWVESLLKEAMAEKRTGILVVTHADGFAERVCSDVIDLAPYTPNGRAVADA